VKGQWESMITGYLADRVSLQGMFLIADIRREITDYDRQLLEWAGQRALPVHILLTKSDKISRGAAQGALQKVRAALQREGRERVSCQVFSSLNRVGVEPAWQRMNELLDLPPAG
jgi:GTP-binding protein